MNNQILVDSSFLFAVFHNRDKNHLRAIEFNSNTVNAPLVPDVILPEVAFLFLRDLGYYAIGEFLAGLVSAQVPLVSLNLADIQRAHQIMQTYPDAKFDLVDTCIMALSKRLQITKICTFDRRDFSIFRPKHCDYLELLP